MALALVYGAAVLAMSFRGRRASWVLAPLTLVLGTLVALGADGYFAVPPILAAAALAAGQLGHVYRQMRVDAARSTPEPLPAARVVRRDPGDPGDPGAGGDR